MIFQFHCMKTYYFSIAFTNKDNKNFPLLMLDVNAFKVLVLILYLVSSRDDNGIL